VTHECDGKDIQLERGRTEKQAVSNSAVYHVVSLYKPVTHMTDRNMTTNLSDDQQ